MGFEDKNKQQAPQQEKMQSGFDGAGAQSMQPPAFQLKAQSSSNAVQMQSNRSPAEQVAQYMATEMNVNAGGSTAASIKAKWDSWNPIQKVEALVDWKNMVNYRAPWDHKPHIESTWTRWQNDPTASVDWFFDIWSNIHYGFVGRACGFSESILLNGAGVAQMLGGTVPDGYWSRRLEEIGDADVFRALDDPADQAAISVGCNMFGSTVTEASLLAQVRAHVGSLNHR